MQATYSRLTRAGETTPYKKRSGRKTGVSHAPRFPHPHQLLERPEAEDSPILANVRAQIAAGLPNNPTLMWRRSLWQNKKEALLKFRRTSYLANRYMSKTATPAEICEFVEGVERLGRGELEVYRFVIRKYGADMSFESLRRYVARFEVQSKRVADHFQRMKTACPRNR